MVKPTKLSKPVKGPLGSSSMSKPTAGTNLKSKSSSKNDAKLYSSFNPIPISIPCPISIPSSSKRPLTSTTHYIYVRPHKPSPSFLSSSSSTTESTGDRTVFATNLPVDITERDLRTIFSQWGVIETIELGRQGDGDVLEKAVKGSLENEDSDLSDDDEEEDEEEVEQEEGEGRKEPQFIHNGQTGLTKSQKRRAKRNKGLPPSIPTVTPLPSLTPRTYGPSGSHIAYITYLDTESLNTVMSYSGAPISHPKYGTSPNGLEYYKSLHSTSRPSHQAIRLFADTSMERYDRLHSLLLSSRARQKGAGALVDEDGFTVVVRGGRYGRTGGRGDEGKKSLGVGVAKRGLGPKEAKGGAAELTDFYKFQKVDRKRKGTFMFTYI